MMMTDVNALGEALDEIQLMQIASMPALSSVTSRWNLHLNAKWATDQVKLFLFALPTITQNLF